MGIVILRTVIRRIDQSEIYAQVGNLLLHDLDFVPNLGLLLLDLAQLVSHDLLLVVSDHELLIEQGANAAVPFLLEAAHHLP